MNIILFHDIATLILFYLIKVRSGTISRYIINNLERKEDECKTQNCKELENEM